MKSIIEIDSSIANTFLVLTFMRKLTVPSEQKSNNQIIQLYTERSAFGNGQYRRNTLQRAQPWHAADVFEKSVPATRPAQSPPAIHGGDSDAVAPPLVVPRRLPYVAATHSRC